MAQNDDVLDDQIPAGDEGAADPDAAGTPPSSDPPTDEGGDVLDTDGKGDDTAQSTGDVLSDDDDAGDEGVPDSYTFDLPDEMSEAGIELSEERLEAFKEAAKEMELTQKQFQKVVEYDLKRTQEATGQWQDRVQGWRDAARADKEFGGEAYDANVKAVSGVVNQFGDGEMKALLKSPSPDNPEGLAVGNHPAFLRMMNRIAKKLGDPQFVLGDDVTKDDSNEARLRRMYPSMYSE